MEFAMNGDDEHGEDDGRGFREARQEAVDLIDFHLRWQEFRPSALRALRSAPDPSSRNTVEWLIFLADRVSQNDLE